MKLDKRTRLLLWLMSQGQERRMHEMTVDEARRSLKMPESVVTNMMLGKPIEMAHVEDRMASGRHGDIPVRVYRPVATGKLPILVFYHGGGWVVGTLDSYDRVCRRLARDSNALVVSVDYRLAPEHRFPIPVEDAYDAFLWVAQQASELGGDSRRIAVAGDSAGGNLSAVVSQMTRDLAGPAICQQILIYPATDATGHIYESHRTYANAPILYGELMNWFFDHYKRSEADRQDPRLSPIVGNLANLPPALIVTAEYDPLKDEGAAYAKGMQAAGSQARCIDYPGMLHGFLSLGNMASRANEGFAAIAAALVNAFDKEPVYSSQV